MTSGIKRLAVCSCGAPLISTLAFAYAEFYCLECGAHLGLLDPHSAEETPELTAHLETLRAEWDEHVGPHLRIVNGWFRDCDKCSSHREYHRHHATDEERAAHEAALRWLRARVAKSAGAHA